MSKVKVLTFVGNYDKYSTDPNPTSNADMQTYIDNQNKVVKNLINDNGLLWQPSTAFAVNFELYLGGSLVAICTSAGTSGSVEPTWASGVVIDGGVTWKVFNKYEGLNTTEKTATVSSGTISLDNGSIQTCSANAITLPAVREGFTLTLICTAASVTWSGSIKWFDSEVPDFGVGDNVVTFVGKGNYWYGNGGNYGEVA